MPKELPYQEWGGVLVSLYRQSVDKKQFMDAMKLGGINIRGVNITPLDFFSTANDLTDEEILEAISNYLDINNIEDNIENFNEALKHSKEYIQEYLLRKLPREINNLEIKSIQDVLNIFKKTSTLKPRDRQGLAPAYCELIKVMTANFMFDKKELQYLVQETEYVYDKMFDSARDERSFNTIRRMGNGYDKIVGTEIDELGISDKKTVLTDAYYRGKSRESFVTKFLIKPKSTVQEAIKDGIGIKIEAKNKDDIQALMGMVLKELFLQFGVTKVEIENTRLFNPNEMKNIEEEINFFSSNIQDVLSRKNIKTSNITIKITEDNNPHSDSHFRAIKICNGILEVPKGGAKKAMIIDRDFEVQFVLSSNSNEDKFSNHYVYEAKKKLVATTRNIGSFSEKYLDVIVQEASFKSGLSAEKIKEHFLDTILSKIISSRGKTKRFVVSKRVLKLMEIEMFYNKVKLQQKDNKT